MRVDVLHRHELCARAFFAAVLATTVSVSLCGVADGADSGRPDIRATVLAARAALDVGDTSRADALVQSVTGLAQSRADRLRVAAALTLVGEAYMHANDYADALPHFQAALPTFDALGENAGSAEVLRDIGLTDSGLGKFADVLVAEERAAPLHHQLNDSAAEAADFVKIAQANWMLHENSAAVDAAQRALAIEKTLGSDPQGTALAYQMLAVAQASAGDIAASLDSARSGLPIAHDQKLWTLEANFYRQEESDLGALGRHDEERTAAGAALAIYRANGDTDGVSQMLFAAGTLDVALFHYADAVKEYDEEVAIERKSGRPQRLVAPLESLGGANRELYHFNAALRAENEALAVAAQLPEPDRTKRTMIGLTERGNIYRDLAEYRKASDDFSRVLDSARATSNQLGMIDAYANLGTVYEDEGLHAQAAAQARAGLPVAHAARSAHGEAVLRENLAVAEAGMGDDDGALADDQAALAQFEALGDAAGQSSILVNVGALDARIGDFAQARAALARARALVATTSDVRVAIGGYANLAYIESRLGRIDDALADHQAALALARTVGDRKDEAVELANLALLDQSMGRIVQAQSADERARAIDHDIGNRHAEAAVLGGVSGVYAREGRLADAVRSARDEQLAMHELHDTSGEFAAWVSLGTVYDGEHRCRDGLAAFKRADVLVAPTRDRSAQASAAISIAGADECLSRWADAHANASRGAALARRIDIPNLAAQAQFELAYADARLAHRTAAMAEAESALALLDSLRPGFASTDDRATLFRTDGIVYDFDWYTAYLAALAEHERERRYALRALAVFERRAAWALLDEVGRTAARRDADVPPELIAQEARLTRDVQADRTTIATLRLAPQPDAVAITAASAQLASDGRSLRAVVANLRERYPRYYALEHPQPVTIEALQRLLRPSEVVLAYDVLGTSTLLWEIDRNGVRMQHIAAGEHLGPRVNAFVHALRDAAVDPPATAGRASAASASLYAQLVPAAIRPQVERATHLIVVPSGPLFGLPWEALQTQAATPNAAPHYLIEEHSVSYVPSLTLLALSRTARASARHASQPLLVFADPDYAPQPKIGAPAPAAADAPRIVPSLVAPSEPAREPAPVFPPLPETGVEAEAVRAALGAPASGIHLGDDASTPTLLRLNASGALANYRYVLFATHAEIPEDSQATEPSLILAHPDVDGTLGMSAIFGLTLNADFVALSACDTGAGNHPPGEGISGLTRAFMYAGTPAISVTLWPVADRVGPRLTPAFFAGMHGGDAPAQALQRAKIALIHGSDPVLRRPYYWAPMVIFGDGG